MTTDQSKNLKVNERVCFRGDQADRGKVAANSVRYVTIKWAAGHQSFTGHDDMKRIEFLTAKR
jgi:hypothetical protein